MGGWNHSSTLSGNSHHISNFAKKAGVGKSRDKHVDGAEMDFRRRLGRNDLTTPEA